MDFIANPIYKLFWAALSTFLSADPLGKYFYLKGVSFISNFFFCLFWMVTPQLKILKKKIA